MAASSYEDKSMTEDAKGNKTDGIAMFQRMIEMKLDKEKKRGNEMGKVFEDYLKKYVLSFVTEDELNNYIISMEKV